MHPQRQRQRQRLWQHDQHTQTQTQAHTHAHKHLHCPCMPHEFQQVWHVVSQSVRQGSLGCRNRWRWKISALIALLSIIAVTLCEFIHLHAALRAQRDLDQCREQNERVHDKQQVRGRLGGKICCKGVRQSVSYAVLLCLIYPTVHLSCAAKGERAQERGLGTQKVTSLTCPKAPPAASIFTLQQKQVADTQITSIAFTLTNWLTEWPAPAPLPACLLGVCSSLTSSSSHCLQRCLLHCHLQLWALHFTPWLWLSHLFFFCAHSAQASPSPSLPPFSRLTRMQVPRSIKSINIFTSQNIWANFRAKRWCGGGCASLSRLSLPLFGFVFLGFCLVLIVPVQSLPHSCVLRLPLVVIGIPFASALTWFKLVHRGRCRKTVRGCLRSEGARAGSEQQTCGKPDTF